MTIRDLDLAPGRLPGWIERFAADHGTGGGIEATADAGALVLTGSDAVVARLRGWFPLAAGPTGAIGPVPDVPGPLLAELTRGPDHAGLVLLRRGGYAIGLAHGGRLVAHKCGTRYVQGRTAAGGQSQQRFARRRGNQADALVEAAAGHAERILAPLLEPRGLDRGGAPRAGLVLGGDRILLEQLFAGRALARLRKLPTREFPDVTNPRYVVLEQTLTRARSVAARIEHPDAR
ncbi:hypothetical protein GCG21_00770 [Pseudactinotalea sp. HY160]|uniref:acVLRF1 family peptidyl-tRNA hydrolase n=1 Tax=Pseudactinotalea sp. HY160 TaxID=2654490 RepID=UPI0013133046|nr:hypothetical protein [Pseudactinotalea sp. HY160]